VLTGNRNSRPDFSTEIPVLAAHVNVVGERGIKEKLGTK